MQAIDDQTRQRFYALSLVVADIDGTLSPEIVPSSPELGLQHGLFLHPSPLRSIALWLAEDTWLYRNIELNVSDGTVFQMGEVEALAAVDDPDLGERTARMLARAGSDVVTNISDRIIVPRENVATVFDNHLAGAARLAFSARAWLTRNGLSAS